MRSATRSPGGGFCRIPIDGNVPHPTTLMKLTTRCGVGAVDGCNEALLAKAAQAKLLRTNRLRADTTVVPADVAYPTDSGLLAKAVRRIASTGRRVQAAGGGTRTRVRDRSRSAGKRAHGIAAKLRLRSAQGKDEAQATVRRITGELAHLAERAATDAEALLANGRRALRRAQAKAEALAAAGGKDDAAGRRRGRLRRAVNDDGVVLDHTLHRGNPADAPQLAPAVERVTARTSRKPRTVTADRGYGEAKVDDALHEFGVKNVVIPRKANRARPDRPRNTSRRSASR